MNPYQFFLRHAGYSYNPATQSPMQGRIQNARRLAAAERKARDNGLSFVWAADLGNDSGNRSDIRPSYTLWMCRMVYPDSLGRAKGATVASLGGIDFGRDGEPWGNPYRRVVEAKLALEALDQLSEVQL